MPFNDRLTAEVTPQRVYALCKLVSKENDKEKLRDFLVPQSLNKDDRLFKVIYNFSKGDLIEEDGLGNTVLRLSDSEIESIDTFRKAINRRTFLKPELVFCRFTAWFIARGRQVYREKLNALIVAFDEEINIGKQINIYNNTNANAWRIWAGFLGFGFQHGDYFIPNTAVRIKDSIDEDCDLQKDKPIPFRKFINWLSNKCPELDYGTISINNRGKSPLPDNYLSVGVSAGLRVLHDKGIIRLHYERDTGDIWHLDRSELHDVQELVSEVLVRGDKLG